jgi:membrane protein implicated in regulation of membrane protease activity
VSLITLKEPATVWFIIGLACIIAEFGLPGLVIIFFGIGAWVVALLLFVFDLPLALQIMIFLLVSVTALLFLRKKFLPRQEASSDVTEDLIGRSAIVKKALSKGKPGTVSFKGAVWKASTESPATIEAGQQVRIVGHESIVLFVEPLPLEE